MNKFLTVGIFLFFYLTPQLSKIQAQQMHYADIELRVDTAVYRLSELRPHFRNAGTIPFRYRHEHEMAELVVIPLPGQSLTIFDVRPSPGVIYLGSEKNPEGQPARIYLRFDQITLGNFFRLQLGIENESQGSAYYTIEFQPVVDMQISIVSPPDEIFLGEVVVHELSTNLPGNIVSSPHWTMKSNYHYRIVRENEKTFLHLAALSTGLQTFNIEVELYKPFLDEQEKPIFLFSFSTPEFSVKTSRLAFLGTDLKEIMMDDISLKKGVEIQIDNHRLLQANRTYRIEAQEEPGGALIAEIFTRNSLANNKMLCIIRPYNYHQSRDGYLYIKDGDQPRFMLNFSVLPQTTIHSVKILREGREWSDQLRVNPNESAIVRIEGVSLSRSAITFDIPEGKVDTISWSDAEAEVKLTVPVFIPKSQIGILVNNKPTGHALTVAEYQRPRPLDFVSIDYGEYPKMLDSFTGPLFYEDVVRDIRVIFHPEMIDQGERLFGKQYLDIEVRILGTRGELLEAFKMNDVAICPGDNSPRYTYYSRSDCRSSDISLNQNLSRKTYDWDIWTRAVITISHATNKYQGGHHKNTMELILQKPLRFDVDVSFPAGLLIMKPGEDQIGNLSGISMAIVAQFSFYQRNKIAKLKPYSVGAGFLALNAFNFSEKNTNRDMGVVIIGSIFPTNRNSKMSFPLYVGGGYFLNQSKWFLLLGPGIRVSF